MRLLVGASRLDSGTVTRGRLRPGHADRGGSGAHRLSRPALQPVRRPDRGSRTCASSARSAGLTGTAFEHRAAGAARLRRAGRVRGPARRAALRRHEPEARPGLRPRPRAAGAAARRADRRRGSGHAPGLLAAHRPRAGRWRRRRGQHAVHGRGHALQPHRLHVQRPDPGRGDAARARRHARPAASSSWPPTPRRPPARSPSPTPTWRTSWRSATASTCA